MDDLTREAFETILGGEFVSLSDEPGRRSNEKFSTYTNGEEYFCRPVGKVDTRGHSWSGVARLMIYNGTLPPIVEKEIEPDGDQNTQTDNGGRQNEEGRDETEVPQVAGLADKPIEAVSFSLPKAGNVGNAQKAQGNQGKGKVVRKG
jgi:hypothetical protein